MPDRNEASPPVKEEAATDEAAATPESATLSSWDAPERPDWRRAAVENSRALIAVGMLVAGVVFVLLGWYGAAHTNIFTEQIPYLISGGLLGLGLIIVAGIMASSVSLERRTDELRRDLLRAVQMIPAGDVPTNGYAPARAGNATVLVLAGGHSYHLAGCPIVEGKELREMGAREAIVSGLAACKLCGPE
jgi:hypothetical protein